VQHRRRRVVLRRGHPRRVDAIGFAGRNLLAERPEPLLDVRIVQLPERSQRAGLQRRRSGAQPALEKDADVGRGEAGFLNQITGVGGAELVGRLAARSEPPHPRTHDLALDPARFTAAQRVHDAPLHVGIAHALVRLDQHVAILVARAVGQAEGGDHRNARVVAE